MRTWSLRLRLGLFVMGCALVVTMGSAPALAQ